jgi:peptidyl-prolyl cis-trans isomerase D
MSGVIATLHAPLQTSIALNRGTNSGLFTPQVVRTLFDTKTGDSFFAPINANTFIVARVSGVAHPQPPPNDMRYLAGVNQFSGELGADLVISLAKAIQKKEGLTINQKMVDQTVSGNGSGS